MKKQHFILATVVLAFLLSTISFSQANDPNKLKSKMEIIEGNYLMGLNSDNLGLKMSCAYFLGEMKSEKAVIPLMEILNKETHEGVRIMAAWSLSKIGDPRGIYLLQQTSNFCDCVSVQCMSQYYYMHYLLSSKGSINFDKFAAKK